VFSVCAKNSNFTSENNYSPAVDGDIGPFYTFSSIALSAGYSRLYGGIHPLSGNLGGLSVGSTAGAKTFEFLCANYIGHAGCLSGMSDSGVLLVPLSLLALTVLFVFGL
jgi:hypothetical protein